MPCRDHKTVSMESFPLGPFHVNDYSANFVVNVAQRIIRLMVSVSDRGRYDDNDSTNDIYEKQNFDADCACPYFFSILL